MKTKYFKNVGMTILATFFAFIVNAGENKLNSPDDCFDCYEAETTENFNNDESYDVESWMLDQNFWKISNKEDVQSSYDNLEEDNSKIESWMLDENFWKIDQKNNDEIALEDWMFNSDLWKI